MKPKAFPRPWLRHWRWVRYALATVVVLGVMMRIAWLESRPLHHDEAIHATLSYQWWENPEKSTYRYDPTYHGPFLYTFVSRMYPFLGVGIWQARFFPLFFGLLSTFTPLLFIPWIGRGAAWLAVVFLSVSPLFTYYSRFLAHDMPSIFFSVTALAFFLRFRRTRAPQMLWIAATCFGLLFSVKAVGFLYAVVFLSFGVLYWLLDSPKESKTFNPVEPLKEFIGDEKHWFSALAFFCFAYALFQTSLFRFPEAFPEGLFTKVFTYWWGQHSIERVKGPVIFHLRSLALHELPVLITALVGTAFLFWRNLFGKLLCIASGVLFIGMVLFNWPIKDSASALGPLLRFFKIQTSADLFVYFLCLFFGIGGLWIVLRSSRSDRKVISFLLYWSFASLAIYSYVGEKVPWLSVHVAYPFILLSSYLAARTVSENLPWLIQASAWKKKVLIASLLLAVLYQIRVSYFVTFLKAGAPTDLLSQVHNSSDVNFTMDWIKRTSFETGERPERIPLAIIGTPVWAYYFHLIDGGYKKFALDAKSLDGTQRFVIVDEKTQKEIDSKMVGWGYRSTKLIHSGWWVPEHGVVSWKDWIRYAWRREPSTPVGTTPMFVYFKPL